MGGGREALGNRGRRPKNREGFAVERGGTETADGDDSRPGFTIMMSERRGTAADRLRDAPREQFPSHVFPA